MVTLQQIGKKLTIIFFLLWSQGQGRKVLQRKNCKECVCKRQGETLNAIHTTNILYVCIILQCTKHFLIYHLSQFSHTVKYYCLHFKGEEMGSERANDLFSHRA